jgi:hypothetical protein
VFEEGRRLGGDNVGVSDIMTKSYGQGFHKVDIKSTLFEMRAYSPFNISTGIKLRSVLGMGDIYIVITICENRADRKTRKRLLPVAECPCGWRRSILEVLKGTGQALR